MRSAREAAVTWMRRAAFGLAMVGSLAALGGCATSTTDHAGTVSYEPRNTGPIRNNGRDVTTPSDETEAQRRARIRLNLGSAYYAQGQLTTALDEVKLALQASPNLAEAYSLRGLIYVGLGDDRLAEESFQRALQLAPNDADTMHNFGYFLCERRRYGEADPLFRRALAQEQYRSAPRTLLVQGVCEARAGQLDEAEKTLTRAFELDAGNPATAMNLADVLYRRGQYERARFYVRRVNGITELRNAESLWLAARIENRLGNTQGAQEFGGQLRARYPEARETLAFERGQFDE